MEFVNLEDPLEEHWARFRRKHPWFSLPVEAKEKDLLEYVSILRGDLRDVFDERDRNGSELRELLGVWPGPVFLIGPDSSTVGTVPVGGLIQELVPGLRGRIVPAVFVPLWRAGRFEYQPTSEFQRILYALWRESWRAKRCPRCRGYFVATQPGRLYCSVDCGDSERAVRNAEYWADHKGRINAARRRRMR